MAADYTIVLEITVTKEKELIESTEYSFEKKSFSKMTNAADLFFELIEKIQKKM
ncbi:MAG: hypothetical protein Q8M94_18435 [Ignavibacteria bacterium]|nr:hypothetical protein [Ignavibacteria bacterium]